MFSTEQYTDRYTDDVKQFNNMLSMSNILGFIFGSAKDGSVDGSVNDSTNKHIERMTADETPYIPSAGGIGVYDPEGTIDPDEYARDEEDDTNDDTMKGYTAYEEGHVFTFDELVELVKEALNIRMDIESSFKDEVNEVHYTQASAEMVSSNKFTTNGGIATGKYDNMIKAIQKNDAIQNVQLLFYHEKMTSNKGPLEAQAVVADMLGMFQTEINDILTPESMLLQVGITGVVECKVDE